MTELVAISLPANEVSAAVARIWDRGDAVALMARGLAPAVRAEVLATLAPTRVLDESGERATDGGEPVEPGDALVMSTGGTSGRPRGVVLTHGALDHAAFASSSYLGVDSSTRWLACLPLVHIGGFGVVSRALRCQVGLVVHDRFDAAAVSAAATAGCTHTSLVPTTLRRIDASAFERILLGGSAIPSDRPDNCIATYGMTESCGGVVYEGLALNGVSMRIDDDGQILLRSPTMLRCYRDGTDPVGPDGWYRTGDLGGIDPASGRLTVTGRADDMIITGGENVWPARVEAVLQTVEGVADVAVVGRPDPEWGQRVVAVVVPVDPSAPPRLDALVEPVRAMMPRSHAPTALELVDSLPRAPSGKVARRLL